MSAEDAARLDSETFPLFVNTSMNSWFHLSNLLLPDVIMFAPFFIVSHVSHVSHVSLIRGGSGDLLEAGRPFPNLEEGLRKPIRGRAEADDFVVLPAAADEALRAWLVDRGQRKKGPLFWRTRFRMKMQISISSIYRDRSN